MVPDTRMRQFVQDQVVDELIRNSCQINVKIYIVFSGAAPPSGLLVSDKDPVICKAVPFTQIIQPSDQEFSRMAAV